MPTSRWPLVMGFALLFPACGDGEGPIGPVGGSTYPGPCATDVFNESGTESLEHTEFTYDAAGRVIREEFDMRIDPRLDEVREYTYDGQGRLVRERITLLEEVVSLWTYWYEGECVRGEYDVYEDGTIDQTRKELRDGFGRAAEVTRDTDMDGMADWRFTYEYEGSGPLLRANVDYDGDGEVDIRQDFIYDEEGRQVQVLTDQPVDGTYDSRMTRLFDGDLVLEEEVRSLPDEELFQRRTYRYDDQGNLLTRTQVTVIDGVTYTSTKEYDYSCFEGSSLGFAGGGPADQLHAPGACDTDLHNPLCPRHFEDLFPRGNGFSNPF